MKKVKNKSDPEIKHRSRKALTPEAEENRLIALAYDRVEERIINNEATAQELVHFLKLGTMKARLEMQELEAKIKLDEAKVRSLEASQKTEEQMQKVLDAIKLYSGYGGRDEYEEEYYEDY